ncbi:uncharacterized protein AMSG_11016 [Thecamonas trahens ATCC 50062]|uniref:TIR domain-containing protein n=1 Tax=Thecamonas trahens ATCC 50062 TaxID=461836 RepID=A0A0L0DSW0_THETB|nr:hypothetical protein AMSG_11016 [Thecamonas trahens ATCC 50062]KNC55360.1 hypothetical protein AMSG_11016 [Thecamonas trahens ATCC 50062]|eukprot:XP_013753075.1 hypothetical protein AMSG_11016 [Thecamonas trahens ATCC 50062]
MDDVHALLEGSRIIVISVSPYLLASGFAMEEVRFALDNNPVIIPVFMHEALPFNSVWGDARLADADIIERVTGAVHEEQAKAWIGPDLIAAFGDLAHAKDAVHKAEHSEDLNVKAWYSSRWRP